MYLRFLDVLPLAYEAAINEMHIGVIVLDAMERVSHLNPSAERIMCLDGDQVVGMDARQCLPQLEPLRSSSQGHAEIAITRGQEKHTYQVQRTAIMSRERLAGSVVTLNDITERVRLLAEIERHRDLLADLSFLDGLTGIPNRRRFDEYLSIAWSFAVRESQPIALILIDIDHFKNYNDHYGHQAGDVCLTRVASALVSSLRRHTDLVARYGGEEFVCVLPDTNTDGAMEVAESFRRSILALEIPHAYSTAMQFVTISQGVASLRSAMSISSEVILKGADEALYEAKRSGRNAIGRRDIGVECQPPVARNGL
jgi:diguanylate cyclase (GGDEF)-like protein